MYMPYVTAEEFSSMSIFIPAATAMAVDMEKTDPADKAYNQYANPYLLTICTYDLLSPSLK